MSTSKQSQMVLIGSLGLSALLAGGLVGGMAVWRTAREQMQDPQFLQAQLDQRLPESGQPDAGPPPALVRVGVAQRKMIQPQKPIIGRLVEVRKVIVASEVAGTVVDLPVQEGTPVVGGLVCSTLFTLVVVPLLFSLVMEVKALILRTLFGEQQFDDDYKSHCTNVDHDETPS